MLYANQAFSSIRFILLRFIVQFNGTICLVVITHNTDRLIVILDIGRLMSKTVLA